jgi:hypothetical protein
MSRLLRSRAMIVMFKKIWEWAIAATEFAMNIFAMLLRILECIIGAIIFGLGLYVIKAYALTLLAAALGVDLEVKLDPWLILGYAVVSFGAVFLMRFGFLMMQGDRDDNGTENTDRPIVKVCARDGITVVSSKGEYDLWQKQHERAVNAGLEKNNEHPAPKYAGYFSDDSSDLGWFHTGSMDDLKKILEGCVIEKTALFVPKRYGYVTRKSVLESIGCVPVHVPDDLYALVHGKPAPTGMFSN